MLTEFSLIQIKDPSHVRYVLGIKIPLNESTDYLSNPILLKEVVEKQLLFENFLDSLKKYLGDSYDKIVNVIKSPFDIAILIKNLITNPKLLESVLNTYKNKIDIEVQKFEKILLAVSDSIKKIVEIIKKIPSELIQKFGLAVDKIIAFYENIVGKISKYFKATVDFIKNKIGDGWMGLLKTIVSTGVLSYASDKLSFYIKKLTKPLESIAKPMDFIKSINDGEVKKNVDELNKGLDEVVKDVFDDMGENLKENVDNIKDFFSDILQGKNWLWKYLVEYLSKIANLIKGKIKTAGKDDKIDLTHYGRLERDLKKIEDGYIKNMVNKIIIEMNNSNRDNIYNKKTDMSKINNIIKQGINNLLETKGFEDMEVAFGVKHKSDKLSDEEKNQFGPMGQIQTTKGGSFTNPKVPGTTITDKNKLDSGKEAQSYYKELAKKIKDYQTSNGEEKYDSPKVPTNTDNEDDRIETTGYDVGISGMEVVSDKAEKQGGSEGTKKAYKDRLNKLNGNDNTYQKLKKNADKTNNLKYNKDAQNTRPAKAQSSKQPEQLKKTNENFMIESDIKMTNDVEKLFSLFKKLVMDKYPTMAQRIDQPAEKAQIIAVFAKAFGIEPAQLGRVKSILDKDGSENKEDSTNKEENKETTNMGESINSKNIFKANGKLVSESQVIKLTEKLPSRVKVNETVFAITDGENTYKMIWEGDSKDGEAIITNFKNKTAVNEDVEKMKHLWGFKTNDSISTKKNITESGEDAFKRMFKMVKESK